MPVRRTLKDSLVPLLDRGTRPLGGLLGLRAWTVIVRVRTWTGDRPGVGTSTKVDTTITVGDPRNPQPVYVDLVSERDVIASNGLYHANDVRIGPISETYVDRLLSGGFSYNAINPAVASTGREIEWILSGPPTNGQFLIYEKISEEARGFLHYYVVLRSTGQIAP